MEVDACAGEVLAGLDKEGLADNTLLIFTSDNGCSPQADFPALLAKGHNPSYVLRGYKADIWDGGHRVPFIVRWPGKVAAGSTSDQLASLVDFMATAAAVLGVKLPDNAAEDSVSLLPVLLGTAGRPSARPSYTIRLRANSPSARECGSWSFARAAAAGRPHWTRRRSSRGCPRSSFTT